MIPILEVQNVSKKFTIFHQKVPYLNFRDRLSNLFQQQSKEEFYALKNISFQVMPGESFGIIGRNGAGKSTLLKILSRITPPTQGKIVSRGRIASLLEVGTGFHYELSGRENIFMNGSILGMKRAEIRQRFDEIVEFSGTAKFIDTALKHYSSGMQLRLAFAVAAHLEPEILIIDEVLAVGDSEFQKKCLSKMEDVTGQGRTVLFVSHNLPSLKAICKTGMMLQEGQLVKSGSIDEVIDYYTSYQQAKQRIVESIHYFQPWIIINQLVINDVDTNSIVLDGNHFLKVMADVTFTKRTQFELDIHIKKHELFLGSYANFVNSDVSVFEPGRYQLEYTLILPPLRSGLYKIDLYFTEPFVSWFAVSENVINLEVINSNHHTFLNVSSLKWGGVLIDGQVACKKLE